MNLELFTESILVANLGWTLLHSIWQISLVGLVLFASLQVLRRSTPQMRYAGCVLALALSFIFPVLTFFQIYNGGTANLLSLDARQARSASEADAFRSREATMSIARENAGHSSSVASSARVSAAYAWLSVRVPNLFPLAVALWMIGVAFFSLRLGGGFARLKSYRTQATELDREWKRTFANLCERTGVRQTVRMWRSAVVQTPIAIGVLKPVILIPAGLFLQISPRELETIVAHELIHIRRYDPLVNVAQCLVETVLFYHPVVWLISREIRREREFAADRLVTEIFHDSHVTYARALANLEEFRLRTNQQMPRHATAANGGNFMERIQRILKIKTEASNANSAWTAGLALVFTSAFFLALFSFSSSDLVNAQSASGGRKLAIGFVSIPPVDRTANAPKDSDATARLLIQELKEHKVPAIGFLQGNMVSDGEKLYPVRANIALMWRDAGFEIGFGGYKHISLYHTPVEEYIANLEKNERVAKHLLGASGPTPRYFSYPYLNVGKSADDRARVESWLATRGYAPVKYTFDNSEWMYSFAYDMARNDNDLNTMKEIRDAYLQYMDKMFDHYEAYSAAMFGRDIPQTLVLTSSRLVTDTADEFFAIAGKRGYTFVGIEEAQSDPAYKTKENFTGEAGISWFERWTMAKGDRLRPEPEVDKFIQKTWDERRVAAKK